MCVLSADLVRHGCHHTHMWEQPSLPMWFNVFVGCVQLATRGGTGMRIDAKEEIYLSLYLCRHRPYRLFFKKSMPFGGKGGCRCRRKIEHTLFANETSDALMGGVLRTCSRQSETKCPSPNTSRWKFNGEAGKPSRTMTHNTSRLHSSRTKSLGVCFHIS